MEADEVTVKLELCDKENKRLKEEMNKEIENVSVFVGPNCRPGINEMSACHRCIATLQRGFHLFVF